MTDPIPPNGPEPDSHDDMIASASTASTVELNNAAQRIAAHYRTNAVSPSIVSGTLRLAEFALIAGLGLALLVAYVGMGTPLIRHYAVVILLASVVAVVAADVAGNYRLRALRQPFMSTGRFVLVWSGTLALTAFAGFFLKVAEDFSRVWVGAWFLGSIGLVMAARIVMDQLVRRWTRDGRMERRAVIVGGGAAAEMLIHSIERQPDNDIRICGIFDDRSDDRSPPVVAGYPKLGNIDELIAFARIAHIDMLIVSLPATAESRLLSLVKRLWVLPVDIRLSAQTTNLRYLPRTYSFIGSVPMLDIADRPISDWDSVAKRAFDIVFSLAGIVVFLPVMVATALLIKLDSRGPVFFRQQRLGFNNEVIEVYKFRSMYVDQCDPTARNAVTKDDPRVTRIGRFIRKASIDELPQFFNVLEGSLSLVGPRPHAVSGQTRHRLYHDVVDGYFARHRVKPGVTGWAQINGWRGEIDSDEKIRMRTQFDLYYIENWSLWLDLKILFLTPIRLLDTRNAY